MKNYLDSIDREALRARAEQMLDYASDARDCAARLTDYAVYKAHGFSLFDFAVLSSCLLTFGLWLGSCFAKFFKKFRCALFIAFAASWLYLFWRVFFEGEE